MSGVAIASMVLFGVSVFSGLMMFVLPPFVFVAMLSNAVGLVLGIVGMVQTGKKGRKRGFGLALAGMILNGIAMLAYIALFILVIAVIAAVSSSQRTRPNYRPTPGYTVPAYHRIAPEPARSGPPDLDGWYNE